jgi:16S rRNA C967 or C1407 C5-methylase (RsmB/RsmF family)
MSIYSNNMTDVSNLLQKLSSTLFPDVEKRSFFTNALLKPQPYFPCILWLQPRSSPIPFTVEPSLDWQPAFVDRLRMDSAPGRHPLHDSGSYYCLDFSSVFAASVTLSLSIESGVIVDLCAAPGGKSMFLWRQFKPVHLICNETISKRVGMLIGNLKRCRIDPVSVVSCDPSLLATAIPQSAQLVFTDAPCTGQSLLAKGLKAPGCFHPLSIRQNAQRQKRILANAAQIVAPGGYLAYSTCTFSPDENEKVGQWLVKKFPQFMPQVVPSLVGFQSHLSDLPCYRMWPQSGLGVGAFTMLFQNTETGSPLSIEASSLPNVRWVSTV